MFSEKISSFEEGQVLLFDKPLYWTSFDLVNKVRIIIRSTLGIRKIKIGHAGTLDPLASGLMIICTGKATRRIEEFRDLEKEYIATIHMGETTPSYDLETEINGRFPVEQISENIVIATLKGFLGEQKQIPPVHSAKMIDGRRAYEFARKGIKKEMNPVTVYFRELDLLSFGIPDIRIRILCSKGTYIRSFARDLGKALGSGAYLASLERTAIGPYLLKNAFSLEFFENSIKELKQI
ncbi:MAG: tRNA pseudouridine(55) synthase TruB [Bacteroidetes bacterium RBG_19FT_COMBO_42_7]|jgi:tRNA pseudouridine55 synthase|nr:MAG: tRNA pseudouridine(55) synthase TruB [Bacteroidetes bacterium RBG_13_42_15]OFY82068.1 MAG: tRNA pseudouridine(55) synthase TruB [Bacteroidetes bacterium RBG_19FT_COMBO_42_7]